MLLSSSCPSQIPRENSFCNALWEIRICNHALWVDICPLHFSEVNGEILDGLHEFTVTYLDDILIHSQTWDQHMKHLDTLFTTLRKAGLNDKERKCTIASGSCVYLGHVVGNGSVKPMDCKVSAVKNLGNRKQRKM